MNIVRGVGPTMAPQMVTQTDPLWQTKILIMTKRMEQMFLQACNQRKQSWMNYLQTIDKKVDTREENLIIVFKEFQSWENNYAATGFRDMKI